MIADSLYQKTCQECSKLITKRYSTSFSMGIRLFDKTLRDPIYAIYGFVRFADEIVDTFKDCNKAALLDRFESATFKAINEKVSLNPVLHSFQWVVNKYHIDHNHISAFIKSMRMDLDKYKYDQKEYEVYIFGSAEVVGLMCLKVFLGGDTKEFDKLEPYAKALGSAFQKINFLRDIKSDYIKRQRVYFPHLDIDSFDDQLKEEIQKDIKNDFKKAAIGLDQLPKTAKFGVKLAYTYYLNLYKKIAKCPASAIMDTRIRVSNRRKLALTCGVLMGRKFKIA